MLNTITARTNRKESERNIGGTSAVSQGAHQDAEPSQQQLLDPSKTYHATVPCAAGFAPLFSKSCPEGAQVNGCAAHVFTMPHSLPWIVAKSPQPGDFQTNALSE
jgi:hypothetical protein